MKNEELRFPDELEHLTLIQSKLDHALHEAEDSVNRLQQQYTDARHYMSESRGEIDPHEMFQNELLLKQTDHTGAFASEIYEKLCKMKDSPYFARIDFCERDCSKPETYYIGRFSFRHGYELLILDWRAPISGMFYDHEIGPAGFDAPSGRIDGKLTKKRQFSIKNGVMEYALETSANIQDDVLQKELSHTSSEKMKTIISTIQKEQNQIIRDENTKTLIIQGAAGSGKTSIALHRIAFLLYRYKDHLEYNCETYTWRVRFKSTLDFVKLMDTYIKQMPDEIFIPDDISFDCFTAEREWILKRFHAYSKHPV